jgi:hypothetical protein
MRCSLVVGHETGVVVAGSQLDQNSG